MSSSTSTTARRTFLPFASDFFTFFAAFFPVELELLCCTVLVADFGGPDAGALSLVGGLFGGPVERSGGDHVGPLGGGPIGA